MKRTFEPDRTVSGTGDSVEALQARVEQLELVLQATEEGLFEWNIVTGEVYYSPRWKAMLGYDDNEFPNTTDEWQQRVHPDDLEVALRVIREYVAGTRDTCEVEHRLRHKDGTYRWIYERAVAARDEEGRAIRLVGSHADITARKQAEEALARRDAILEAVRYATEHYLRNPASWSENVVEMLGVFGRALDVSRAYIFETEVEPGGTTRSAQRYEWAATGARSLLDYQTLYGFAFADLGWERWEAVMRQGAPIVGRTRDFPPAEQEELKREDTLSLAAVPIMVDGAWWGFIGFDDCVTERVWSPIEVDALKAAASTLGGAIQRDRADAAAARLAAIVESTNDAIFGMLRNGTITAWNAGAERLYGYAEADIIGKRVHQLLPPAELDKLRTVMAALPDGEQPAQPELLFTRQDGSQVPVSLTFSLIRDARGEVIGTSAIGRDVSARWQAERDIRQRDAILDAVRYAAERFLDTRTTWEEAVQDVLQRLGEATGVSQVYVSQLAIDGQGEAWSRELHYWSVPGDLMPPSRAEPRGVPLRAMGLGELVDQLLGGEAVFGHTRDFPTPASRTYAEAQGVRSWAIVPIFMEGVLWGVIGLDEFESERDFSAPERDALKAAAGTLGAAISREHAEAELRESQRSLSTLFSNLPGMAYRCRFAPDWDMEFVSEGALELTGYRPEDLVGSARLAYADLIHPDDREMVWAAVSGAVQRGEPFKVTYRIAPAGGRETWVLEQGRGVPGTGSERLAIEGIVTDVTDRVLARQQLEQRVEERTRELSTLLNVSTGIASTLELQPLLGQILDQFGQVVEHTAAALFLLDGDTGRRMLDYRGPLSRGQLSSVRPLAEVPHCQEVVRTRKPVIIPDVHADTPLAASFRADVIHDLGAVPDYAGSWLGVPLIFREQVIGLLAVVGAGLDAYTARDAELAMAFASHAAVAIVNARLYEQAQGTAALEERQRLARELHDSVSQALFGIGLGARTARTLLDNDPAKAAAPLDYVLSLAEAGLTEMRALIFELRPEALEQEGLVAALEKQAANLRARHGIAVEADLGDPGETSLAVEEAIYRIAQEALNNIVKHARATVVHLRLAREPGRLVAEIRDNGSGFDATASFSGHLGLRTMQERAARLGGTVEIESAADRGTRLRVNIPV